MTNPERRPERPFDRDHPRDRYVDPNNRRVDNRDPRNAYVDPRVDTPDYDHDMVNQKPDAVNGYRPATNPTTYRNGYDEGRLQERQVQQNLRTRDNDNAARGLLIGIILMSFVGLVVGLLFYLAGQNQNTNIDGNPTVVPLPTVPAQPEEPETPTTNRTTIIERTREVIPVPQPQEPAPQPQQAPVQQAPVQQAPVQQAPVQQAPDQAVPQQAQPAQPGVDPATGGAPAAPAQ